MKNKNSSIDLFSPISELFYELCVLLVKLVGITIRSIFNLLSPSKEDLKIDRSTLQESKQTKNENCVGVDTKAKKEVLLSNIDFSKHSIIIGASGFGKTNLIQILQEDYLKQGKPIIFFDPKGDREALNSFIYLCSKYDQRCHVFSEAFEESIKLNPVLEGSVNQIVDRIMSAFDWTEPYYEDQSSRALTKVLTKLKITNECITLKLILDSLILEDSGKDTVGIISKIENITSSDFGSLLEGTERDYTLSKIRNEKSCLYIGLSTQGYGKTAMAIGKMLLGELLYVSYISLRDPSNYRNNKVGVFFDEFGALVTPRFIELENKCRGAGIELTMAIQTLADINQVSPELTIQVIENCSNWFILKQRVSESAEKLSVAIGTLISIKTTEVIEDGEKMGKGTERSVHELIVHPDIIKNLKIGQCILLSQSPHKVIHLNIRKSNLDSNHSNKKQNNFEQEVTI